MRRSLLILFSMIIPCLASAQDLPAFLRAEGFESKGTAINSYPGHNKKDALLTKTSGRPYDVLSYDLYMNWNNPLSSERFDSNNKPIILASDRTFTGSNTIAFASDIDNLGSIDLDAVSLVVSSVTTTNGQALTFNSTGSILTVNLKSVLNKGNKDTIVVNYKYQSLSDRGFYLYPKRLFIGSNPGMDSVFVEERLAYTMSEPQDARYWMPCDDNPDDKAFSTMHVEVPKGFSAVSNGLLISVGQTDSSSIYNWHEKYPIATYLMAATASKYREFSHWYHRITNPQDSVEIQYYVWEKDFNATKTDATEYNAHNAFRNTAEMVKYFSSIFVEYPYEKYGMVALMPFGFGGMEHMTLTSMNRVWLRTDEQSGIAHELAHQWLGDLITCASWKDIWINEGGASWCEALWAQHEWGKPGYYYTNLYARSLYLSRGGLSLPPIYNQPMFDLFNTALTYKKAGLVYSMLQSMLGDSLYFKTLRGLLTDSAFKSITTDDFKNYFKSHIDNPPVDFDTFFDQWIYHAGHPVYRLNTNLSSTDNNKYKVKVKIDQTQTGINVPDVFVVPLTVTCVSADSIQTFSTQIINNQRSQVTEFEAPFKPAFVTVDTVSVLCELASTVTSVREIAGSENINSEVFPNPAVSGSQCYLDINVASAGNLTAEIYNEIGRKSATIYNGFIEPGNFRLGFDTRDLNAGAYMIRVISGNEVITRRFTVVK